MNNPIYIFFLTFFLTSCAIKKIATTDFSLPPKDPAELIKRVEVNNNLSDWTTLKGKANVSQKDRQIKLSINIKSKKDSIIWISARGPFGVEIIRGQITLDSICVLNRINQTYFTKPIDALRDLTKLDLSFYDVQEIITANINILKNNYTLQINEAGFYLKSKNSSYFVNTNYRVETITKKKKKERLELQFLNYQAKDRFPRRLVLKVESKENFEIAINYSQVEFRKPKKLLFEIPYSYNEEK